METQPHFDLLQIAWVQLGAIALLLGFLFWSLRTKTKECKDERAAHQLEIQAERARNDLLTAKVITIADQAARTAEQLTAAVRGLHP